MEPTTLIVWGITFTITFGFIVQCVASTATIISSFAYGNKSTYGPFIGLASQVPWWTLMFVEGLWGLLPVNIMMVAIHARNFLKWTREKQ